MKFSLYIIIMTLLFMYNFRMLSLQVKIVDGNKCNLSLGKSSKIVPMVNVSLQQAAGASGQPRMKASQLIGVLCHQLKSKKDRLLIFLLFCCC